MQEYIIYCENVTERYLVLKELNDRCFIWRGGQNISSSDFDLCIPVFLFIKPESKTFTYCEKLVLDYPVSKIYTASGFLSEQKFDRDIDINTQDSKNKIVQDFLTKWFEMCDCEASRSCEKCKFSSHDGESDSWCVKELFPTNIDDLIEIVNSKSPCKYGADEFDIASDKAVKTLENYANELNSNSDLYKAILFGINEIKKASECCG